MKKFLILFLFCGKLLAQYSLPESEDKVNLTELLNSVSDFKSAEYGVPIGKMDLSLERIMQDCATYPNIRKDVEKKILAELKLNEGSKLYKVYLNSLLEVVGVNEGVEELAKIIESRADNVEDNMFTERMLTVMAESDNTKTNDVLRKLTSSKNPKIKQGAIEALGFRNDVSSIDFISKILNENLDDYETAFACLGALANMKDEKACKILLDACGKIKNASLLEYCYSCMFECAFKNNVCFEKEFFKILESEENSIGARSNAAIILTKHGKLKGLNDEELLKRVLFYLAMNKDVKIPEFIVLEKLSADMLPFAIESLSQRKESYDKLIALTPTTGVQALAISIAANAMSDGSDFATLASFADLYNSEQARLASFAIAGINTPEKVRKLCELADKSSGKAKEFLYAILSNIDASNEIDFVAKRFGEVSDDESRITLLKILGGSITKSDKAFDEVYKLYITLPNGAVRQAAAAALVSCSRRVCSDKNIDAVSNSFDKLSDKDKAFVLRFASENSGETGAKFLIKAYEKGFTQSAKEFSNFKGDKALNTLVGYAKSLNDDNTKKIWQDIIVAFIMKSGAIDSPAADYIINEGVDAKTKNYFAKIREFNLGGIHTVEMPNGFLAASSHAMEDLARAFDNNPATKWGTKTGKEKGQWVYFEMPEAKKICALTLDLGESLADFMIDPKIFVGTCIEDFDAPEFECVREGNKQIFKFKNPQNVKIVRLENNGNDSPWWSFMEVEFTDDPTAWNVEMTDIGNGIKAAASHNPKTLPKAFDGDEKTRWESYTSNQAGMWFQFELPESVMAKSVEFLSKDDGHVQKPAIFIGDTILTMRKVAFSYRKKDGVDYIEFAEPLSFKCMRIESTKDFPHWWSINEVVINRTSPFDVKTKDVGNEIKAGASHQMELTNLAFDGDAKTRWETRLPNKAGMWFQIEFPQKKEVSSIELLSLADRLHGQPKVYVGDNVDDIKAIDVEYDFKDGADCIKFSSPKTFKIIRIESDKDSGGHWWSINEVKVN